MYPQRNSPHPGPSGLAELLSEAIGLVGELGRDFDVYSSRLSDLRERLSQGRFHLAVLGQFKRGKSTLLNSLLGEDMLPTALVPLTAIPTFIRYGRARQATAFFQDTRQPEGISGCTSDGIQSFLSRFVTEEGNPKNFLGVSYVEIVHPAAILQSGAVLIDTPGIGSTFRHNTEATLNFLPQCDAALFIVSSDPPITEVEVLFLKEARKHISRIFFVLNKTDYLDHEDRKIATDFLRKVIAEQVGMEENTPILCVSAKQGLNARINEDPDKWKQSGMEEVEHRIVRFLADEKSEVLCESVMKRMTYLLGEIIMRVQLAIRSLQIPLEDLHKRLDIFEEKIEQVQLERQHVTDLLNGDRKRMLSYMEDQSNQLRGRAMEYLESVLKKNQASTPEDEMTEKNAQSLLAEAIPGYFEHQRGIITKSVRDRMLSLLGSHQKRVDDLIDSIRQTAADLFEVPYHAPESEEACQVVEKPSWITHKWASSLSPIPENAIEKLMRHKTRRRRILNRLHDRIKTLVVHNVENLRWAIYQNINETFRKFSSTMDERLADTLTATHGAIRVTMEKRQKQNNSVSGELTRLGYSINKLVSIQKLTDLVCHSRARGNPSGIRSSGFLLSQE